MREGTRSTRDQTKGKGIEQPDSIGQDSPKSDLKPGASIICQPSVFCETHMTCVTLVVDVTHLNNVTHVTHPILDLIQRKRIPGPYIKHSVVSTNHSVGIT